jgi:hypothetical protein
VSPIISAAAVDAVRPGLRTAFAPARSPATPPTRFAGQPTMRASGGTSRGASNAMPAKRPSTPPASRTPTAAALTPSRNIASTTAASEVTVTTTPALCAWAPSRVVGTVAPSRTAAIGGTRVARRAGRTLASSVMPVPSSSDTVIVCVATTVGESGRPTPSAAISAIMPLAIPRPTAIPIAEATRPMTRPSSFTARLTCLREAPSVRSVANSRVRWATVIDSVLKITNAPTSRAIPPNPSSTARNVFRPSFILAASSAACSAASWACRSPGRSGLIRSTSCAGVVPRFAATEIESKRPSRCSNAWAVCTSQTAMLAMPSESTPPKDTVPLSR